jgi:hypothetical protein
MLRKLHIIKSKWVVNLNNVLAKMIMEIIV